jgi:hypothetical protein
MSADGVTQQVDRLTSATRTDVSVDLGRLERLVPEERLDDTEVGAAVEELGREGVAEEMRVEPDPEPAAGACHGIDDGSLADPPAPGHEERIAGAQRPSCGKIGLQRPYGDGMERHDAILAPLAPNSQTA